MSLHPQHETDQIALEVETGDQSWRSTLGERWANHLEAEAGRLEAEAKNADEENADLIRGYAAQARSDAAAVREKRLMVNHVQCEIIMRKAALDRENTPPAKG